MQTSRNSGGLLLLEIAEQNSNNVQVQLPTTLFEYDVHTTSLLRRKFLNKLRNNGDGVLQDLGYSSLVTQMWAIAEDL